MITWLAVITLALKRWPVLDVKDQMEALASIKSNQIKSNQIKSNQIKSNQFKSNQVKSNQIKSNFIWTRSTQVLVKTCTCILVNIKE